MREKIYFQIAIFIFLLFGLHLIFLKMNWVGHNAILIIIPFIYFIIFFIKAVIYGLTRDTIDSICALLISLSFVTVSLKIEYEYYNFFISLLLIITSVVFRKSFYSRIKETLQKTLLLLIVLNTLLVCTPNTYFLKYFNIDKKFWTNNIDWEYFKGEPQEDQPFDAVVSSGWKWKINKFYNYPPAVLITVVNQDLSWKRNIYMDEFVDSILLNHEQTHLNITELNKRLALDSIKHAWGKSPSEIEQIIEYFRFKDRKSQDEYDSETIHGSDTLKQRQWTFKINESLK